MNRGFIRNSTTDMNRGFIRYSITDMNRGFIRYIRVMVLMHPELQYTVAYESGSLQVSTTVLFFHCKLGL